MLCLIADPPRQDRGLAIHHRAVRDLRGTREELVVLLERDLVGSCGSLFRCGRGGGCCVDDRRSIAIDRLWRGGCARARARSCSSGRCTLVTIARACSTHDRTMDVRVVMGGIVVVDIGIIAGKLDHRVVIKDSSRSSRRNRSRGTDDRRVFRWRHSGRYV